MRVPTNALVACFTLVLPYATLATTLASRSIVPKPISSGCASYPRWNASADTAGPFSVVADSTGSSIDGHSASFASFTNDGKDLYGFITLPKSNARLGNYQNLTVRCTASHLQVQVRSSWVNVYIAEQENWQSSFSFGLEESGAPGISVQAYQHVVNDKIVDGAFLGAGNSTTWSFKYNWGGNAGEYYLLRWVKNPTGAGQLKERQEGGEFPVLDDRDWVGYLKVVG